MKFPIHAIAVLTSVLAASAPTGAWHWSVRKRIEPVQITERNTLLDAWVELSAEAREIKKHNEYIFAEWEKIKFHPFATPGTDQFDTEWQEVTEGIRIGTERLRARVDTIDAKIGHLEAEVGAVDPLESIDLRLKWIDVKAMWHTFKDIYIAVQEMHSLMLSECLEVLRPNEVLATESRGDSIDEKMCSVVQLP